MAAKKAKKTPNKALISPQDRELFRAEVEGITPITQDRAELPVVPVSRKKVKLKNLALETQRDNASDPFSDHYEPLLPEGTMSWVADGDQPYLAKQLRRGNFAPEMTLDLHGYTKVQAKRDLAAAIKLCVRDSLSCLCVIHGIGHGVLRQQVPLWLAQHPEVRAFHQAPLEWGGHVALLVLLRSAHPLQDTFHR